VIIAPFPFEALPKATRERFRPLVPLDALGAALNAAIEIVRITPAERPSALAVGFVDAHGSHHVVEAEPALARELVLRALGQPPKTPTDASKAISADVAGAFAAVIHHALRKAKAPPLTLEKPRLEGPTAWLSVTIDGVTFGAKLTCPPDRRMELVRDDFPITLPIVAASGVASREEIDALAPGDVFLVPGMKPTGEVVLIAPSEERGLVGDLAVDGRLVLRTGRLADHSWDAMTREMNPTLEVALDAPVVVRVELGAVEMKAREWAALADGDVLPLGRKLGEPAILRIAGAEVARGELVQVDGEYGIRILKK
jgi:flagellar motor switch protein FliN/FliY